MKQVNIKGNIIEYQEIGHGKPLVFIHGAFSNGNTWRKVVPILSAHYRCIIPEWPFGGHKIPMSESFDFTPHGIADFIARFLTAIDLNEVAIVANDTGGAYAQVFTSKYKERVSHLVLSNCEGFEVFPPKQFKSLQSMVNVPGYLWLMSKVFSYKPMLKWDMTFGLLSNTLNKENIFDLYVKHFVHSKAIRNDFKKLAVEWNPAYTQTAALALEGFKKPVLVLWGVDDDKLFPLELGKRLKAIFPNSILIEIENSKTYVQEDRPQDFADSIYHFINQETHCDILRT